MRAAVTLTGIGLIADLACFSGYVAMGLAWFGEWGLAFLWGVEWLLTVGALVNVLRSDVGGMVIGSNREGAR